MKRDPNSITAEVSPRAVEAAARVVERLGRPRRANAQHLSKSENWGTPPELISLARAALGRIDLDPASNETWNAAIGAWRVITAAEDGLRTPWRPGAPAPNYACDPQALPAQARHDFRVLLNPPGDPKGERVAAFWRALAGYYALGWVTSAIWIGFSVEQLSRLQRVGAPSHPLCFPTCVPNDRVDYLAAPGLVGGQPGHASFVTLLPERTGDDPAQIERFHSAARALGAVINT